MGSWMTGEPPVGSCPKPLRYVEPGGAQTLRGQLDPSLTQCCSCRREVGPFGPAKEHKDASQRPRQS